MCLFTWMHHCVVLLSSGCPLSTYILCETPNIESFVVKMEAALCILGCGCVLTSWRAFTVNCLHRDVIVHVACGQGAWWPSLNCIYARVS